MACGLSSLQAIWCCSLVCSGNFIRSPPVHDYIPKTTGVEKLSTPVVGHALPFREGDSAYEFCRTCPSRKESANALNSYTRLLNDLRYLVTNGRKTSCDVETF